MAKFGVLFLLFYYFIFILFFYIYLFYFSQRTFNLDGVVALHAVEDTAQVVDVPDVEVRV